MSLFLALNRPDLMSVLSPLTGGKADVENARLDVGLGPRTDILANQSGCWARPHQRRVRPVTWRIFWTKRLATTACWQA